MATSERPIAWLALRKGTPVYTSDGAEVGRVSDVVADVQKDIFSGVAFRHGFIGSDHFVPADLIDRLTETGVHLTVSSKEAEALDKHKD